MKTNNVSNLETNTVVDATPKEKKKLSKKQKVIIVVVSVIVFLALCVGIYFVYKNNNRIEFVTNEPIVIEYGEVYTFEPSSIIKEFDKIDNKDEITYTSTIKNEEGKDYAKIGEYTLTVFYKGKSIEKGIVVKDTVAPVFDENTPIEIEFVKDCKEDVADKFKATDLSNVTITIDDTNVDYSTVGEYVTKLCATDESGNITQKEIKVKIIEPSIILDRTSLEINVGDTETVTATIKGKDKEAKWTSSDESVAKVDNGKITAIKKGTATVDVEANGTKTSITVAVMSKNSSSNSTSNNNQSQEKSSAKKNNKTSDSSSNSSSSSKNNSSKPSSTNNKGGSTSSSNNTATTVNNCENGKHSISIGNMGRWFGSRDELISYYSSIVESWNSKYENGLITWDELMANVPRGYECWSCSHCGKWTGNYKYKK